MNPGVNGPRPASSDQRAARWDEHRARRREELVAAAVAAIDEHGPGASIANIAAAAGVSKPVLYRYFADKDDLYRAVGHWGAAQTLDVVSEALRSSSDPRALIETACSGYLEMIASHPNVFLLLVEHRTSDDPLRDGKELIAAKFARVLGEVLRALQIDAAAAEPWAHGIVGFGLAHGEWWIRRRTLSRKASAAYLADFIWNALEGIARENGVDLRAAASLRAVPSGQDAG